MATIIKKACLRRFKLDRDEVRQNCSSSPREFSLHI